MYYCDQTHESRIICVITCDFDHMLRMPMKDPPTQSYTGIISIYLFPWTQCVVPVKLPVTTKLNRLSTGVKQEDNPPLKDFYVESTSMMDCTWVLVLVARTCLCIFAPSLMLV